MQQRDADAKATPHALCVRTPAVRERREQRGPVRANPMLSHAPGCWLVRHTLRHDPRHVTCGALLSRLQLSCERFQSPQVDSGSENLKPQFGHSNGSQAAISVR